MSGVSVSSVNERTINVDSLFRGAFLRVCLRVW